jgi:ribonuclease P protein component
MQAGPQGDVSPRRLTKRSEFLRAARGNRAGRPSVSLQSVATDGAVPGLGFTVSKQVGNSPERNRVKRRLRAAVRTCALAFRPQHDYVLVGRRDALATPFKVLVADIEALIERVDSQSTNRNRRNDRRNKGP